MRGLDDFMPHVLAGMPSFTLSDLAGMRVEAISFFLGVLLLIAWAVQALWNGLRVDFPRLPRLSYKRAVGLLALWGLVFMLVLSMISGARELMTPGAWEKQGLTYRLADEGVAAQAESERWAQLLALQTALEAYADANNGNLPPSLYDLDPTAYESGDLSRAPFAYAAGSSFDGNADRVVAHEPRWFDPPVLVLCGDGAIRRVTLPELDALAGPPAEGEGP